jgi:hypothetical protein
MSLKGSFDMGVFKENHDAEHVVLRGTHTRGHVTKPTDVGREALGCFLMLILAGLMILGISLVLESYRPSQGQFAESRWRVTLVWLGVPATALGFVAIGLYGLPSRACRRRRAGEASRQSDSTG